MKINHKDYNNYSVGISLYLRIEKQNMKNHRRVSIVITDQRWKTAMIALRRVSVKEIERGITWTYNGGRTYNDLGCNRQWVVDLSYLGSLNVHAHVARTVARDRSIEILYRRGVRVTFLDECSWLPTDIHTRRQIATIIPSSACATAAASASATAAGASTSPGPLRHSRATPLDQSMPHVRVIARGWHSAPYDMEHALRIISHRS